MPSILKTLFAGALITTLTLALVELVVRLQPVVPLEYPADTLQPQRRLSFEHHHDVLHVPPVQLASVGAGCASGGAPTLKILYLGDSWMENTDGIPKGSAEQLVASGPKNLCVQIVNAGTTSFAPSLMLVKGERLIRELHPDLVVANIDETDLMDESLRYRQTTLRDSAGRIERVVPNAADMAFAYERAMLVQQPVRTLRLIEQIWYDEVLLPRLRREVFGVPIQIGSYELIMAPQQSRDPRTTHPKEIAYFRQVLREMIDRLNAALPPGRLLLTHHPHLLHIAQGGQPARYNTIVSETVREEAAASKPAPVPFYDAMGDLKALYGDDPVPFFVRGDPFSHLTPEGFRRYGRFIGQALQPMAAAALAAPH